MKTGFTLIELLLVIAIIGLMVVMVWVKVQDLRAEAHDANIKRFMHQLRNAAQCSYNQLGHYFAVCDTDNTLSNTGEFGLLELALENENSGEKVACFVSATGEEFAVSFALVASQGKYWCLEAAGAGIEIDCSITSASCVCP